MKYKLFYLAILLIVLLGFNHVHSFSAPGYKWSKPAFKFYINPQNRDIPPDQVITAIRNGARPWREWVRTVYAGTTTSKRSKNDGVNNVFFRTPEYGALATTYLWKENGEILDVDIVFWDNPWKFYAGNVGCDNGFYITDVATHEFGHAIGLRHSRVKEASMFKSCGWCSNTVRTLAVDDKNAAGTLYGNPALTALALQPEN